MHATAKHVPLRHHDGQLCIVTMLERFRQTYFPSQSTFWMASSQHGIDSWFQGLGITQADGVQKSAGLTVVDDIRCESLCLTNFRRYETSGRQSKWPTPWQRRACCFLNFLRVVDLMIFLHRISDANTSRAFVAPLRADAIDSWSCLHHCETHSIDEFFSREHDGKSANRQESVSPNSPPGDQIDRLVAVVASRDGFTIVLKRESSSHQRVSGKWSIRAGIAAAQSVAAAASSWRETPALIASIIASALRTRSIEAVRFLDLLIRSKPAQDVPQRIDRPAAGNRHSPPIDASLLCGVSEHARMRRFFPANHILFRSESHWSVASNRCRDRSPATRNGRSRRGSSVTTCRQRELRVFW